MRVIAGSARGRKLAAPRGDKTRPTPDRVREALFSILAPNLPDARVLDLFAGTGALGIEALSRGALSATFVEKDRSTVTLLRENLGLLPGASTEVVTLPVERALAGLEGQFDLIFMDPPYDAGLLDPTLGQISQFQLLRRGGIAVCEHRGSASPPQPPAGFSLISTRTWGDVGATLIMCN